MTTPADHPLFDDRKEKDAGSCPASQSLPTAHVERIEADAPLITRIRAYLDWKNEPQWIPCERCSGKGYHHGFGEHGHDPDWCERCGGPGEQPTEPGTWSPDDLLVEALDALTGASVAERSND